MPPSRYTSAVAQCMPPPKAVGVAQRDRDHVHPELVHLLHLVDLRGLNSDRLGVEHQAVHGQPHRGVAQRRRVSCAGCAASMISQSLDSKILRCSSGRRRCGLLMIRPGSATARRSRRCGSGRGHREVHGVDAHVRVAPLEPLHRLAVGGQTVLDEQVLTHPHHVSGIPHGLNLSGHEVQVGSTLEPLIQGDVLVVVVVLERRVRQPGPGAWLHRNSGSLSKYSLINGQYARYSK